MFQYLNRAGPAAAVAAALAMVTPQVAQAAPTSAASPASVHLNGDLTQVRYYRHRWHHGWGGPGPAVAGAALGLFGLALANSYYDSYDYPYYYAPYGAGYGYYGYPYGGYGGWHRGWGYRWRGPVGWHNHR
jgi:hypothetical protein